MASGWPDWARTVGPGDRRVAHVSIPPAVTQIIAAPGVGFRLVLYTLVAADDGGAGFGLRVRGRPIGEAVELVFLEIRALVGDTRDADLGGLPMVENTRIAGETVAGATNARVTLVYQIVAL